MTSPSPVPAAVFGSTGLTGSHILATLLSSESAWGPVHTVSRREPKSAGAALRATIEPDTGKWASALASLSPAPAVAFSAVGTTRAAAGGIANQWKIDHDLNVDIARAAKEAGVRTYVFVSSAGTRNLLTSYSPYARMKNGVEDAIKDLGFESAVILKPGGILGPREQPRTLEGIFQGAIHLVGNVSTAAKNSLGQEADVIGRAAVKAAQIAAEGNAPEKYWVIGASEIVRLGKAEDAAGK